MATGNAAVVAPPLLAEWSGKTDTPSLARFLRGARERLTVRPASDAGWQHLKLASLGQLATEAVEEKGTAWPQPLVSHYARYFRDGNRTAYEGLVARRQQRLTRAVVMAAVSQEPDWLDEVIDGAYLLCEQSSWSWAAHDDVFTRTGDVVPDRSRPYLTRVQARLLPSLRGWIWCSVMHWMSGPRACGNASDLRHTSA